MLRIGGSEPSTTARTCKFVQDVSDHLGEDRFGGWNSLIVWLGNRWDSCAPGKGEEWRMCIEESGKGAQVFCLPGWS